MKRKGPLLLACNHPNSFLDATILADLFKEPVYSLTRGDVFKKNIYKKILASLHMLPVYRTSEGLQNLNINYQTFELCRNIFRKNGIVLIFSEAKCVNEWKLRPLKKGTARLAFTSWQDNIPLDILPVGINYSSFRRFSKNVFINFGEIITSKDFNLRDADGKKNHAFNSELENQLSQLVYTIAKNDVPRQKELLEMKPPLWARWALFIPAGAGWFLHAPLYLPVKNFTYRKTWHNDHYDSVLITLLLFMYPFYVLAITLVALWLTHRSVSWLLIAVMPFTAWAFVQLKPQLDKKDLAKTVRHPG